MTANLPKDVQCILATVIVKGMSVGLSAEEKSLALLLLIFASLVSKQDIVKFKNLYDHAML